MSQGKRIRLPRAALTRLRTADPGLGEVIGRVGRFNMYKELTQTHLEMLVRSIVYQQLSGKAAATIYGRFLELFGGEFPDASDVLAVHHTRIRKAGLSRAKRLAVRDLCQRVDTGRLELDGIERLDDEDAIARLSEVRGIGRWSAQMFLMFQLGRLDVWPEGDLGVRKGVMLLSRGKELPGKRQMVAAGDRYRPYRSVAAWYLWRLLDGDARL